MTTPTTITDLTVTVSELLGIDLCEESVREHMTSPRYSDYPEGSEAMERLLRDVWGDATDGAEYPF